MAEEIAENAETLNDVLGAAGQADQPQDEETAQKVQAIAGSLKLDELIERMQNLPSQVQSGEMQDAAAAAGDGAERMESLAEQLSELHRSIVAPRVDELAKMEEQLTGLDEELDQLETPSEITGWHLEANELLEQLEESGMSEELRREFLEEMKKAGWGPEMRNGGWRWARIEGGYYTAPAPYHAMISRILARIRGQMQELLLGELAYSRDEPIPPQYQELVDRYYQVLSAEGKKP
jgi:hypothetical protein